MENKSQATLYIGLLLVIIGILAFLDINGLLPGTLLLSWSLYFFGISTNLINGFFVGAGMWVLAQSLGFGINYAIFISK